jgi:hypothetical protein
VIHPLRPILELHGNRLNCTFSLRSIQVEKSWSLGIYCPHKCMMGRSKVFPPYGLCISVPSAFRFHASWRQILHQKLRSQWSLASLKSIKLGIITENQETGMRASGHLVSRMGTINHHAKVNVLSKRRWHVWRDCLFHITIKLRPVINWEGSLVDVRIGRVKNES